MPAKLGTEEDVGEGTIGCNLNEMVAEGAERSDKVQMVLVKFVVLGDVHQEVAFDILVLGGPNLLASFVDDLVLVQVMVGGGARRGSEEVREELSFREDREREDTMRRGRRGGRRDGADRGGNDGQREVLYWDISKRDMLDNLLELLVDIGVLWFRVGVLELRTREVVLLGGNVGENLKEVRQGGNKDGRGRGDRNDGRRINDEQGEEGRRADRGVREDGDGEVAGGVAIRAWIVPGVVQAIEEVLNDLVGGGDIYLVDVVNL